MVTNAIFGKIGVVGVGRAENIGNIVIILRMLVGVLDHEADGRTRGLATKNTAEQLDLVLFVAGVVMLDCPGRRRLSSDWM